MESLRQISQHGWRECPEVRAERSPRASLKVLGGLSQAPGFFSKCSDMGALRGIEAEEGHIGFFSLRVPSGCCEGMERKVAGLDVRRQVRWHL